MLTFLIDNIFVEFAGQIFQQVIGKPMGTNCAPLLADLFLYSYEAEFIQGLLAKGEKKLAQVFNFSFRYINDLLSLNNPRFHDFTHLIYPKELELKDTTDTPCSASYLDLFLKYDPNGKLYTRIYDKRDDFNFSIVNFPFLCSNIQASPAYGVYISQLIRYGSACSNYEDFIARGQLLTTRLQHQGYTTPRLKSTFQKFFGRQHDIVGLYEKSASDIPQKQNYQGSDTHLDYFKLLSTNNEHLLIGARNTLLNISMVDLKQSGWEIEWKASKDARKVCTGMKRSRDECQNYIRVLGKNEKGDMKVCGTNAFRPSCRIYKKNAEKGIYEIETKTAAIGSCPYDPKQNNTFVFVDGKLISATVADIDARDSLILKAERIRTEQHDSRWLNDPNFVSSFEIEDKVYFFYRETALENINCGKAVFSRVARVCKNDNGGSFMMQNQWTSFFKARLNCSIPGEFPFYFDEIQSTSEFGKGNYMSTGDSSNRTDMFYAVFSTPLNSIPGSAVCAFTYSDIVKVFKGKFKGHESFAHNWLSVPKRLTPKPHPGERCANDSTKLSGNTLNFIKAHTLMDQAVKASGGAPVLVKLSLNARFTKIAVDFQIYAADQRYYDILFVGTDDGRVIKAINKGQGTDGSSSTIIEDMQIFKNKEPVTDLKIFRDKMRTVERLIVISRGSIISVSLYRCKEQKTCSECVALQDPYCSWVGGECAASNRGSHNILHRESRVCGKKEKSNFKATAVKAPSPPILPTTTANPQCIGTCGATNPNGNGPSKNKNGEIDNSIPNMPQGTVRPQVFNAGGRDDRDDSVKTVANLGHQSKEEENSLSTAQFITALVSGFVTTAIISFVAGYRVSKCIGNQSQDEAFLGNTQEIYGSLQKNYQRNLSVNSDKQERRYVNHTQLNYGDINNSRKHLNIMVNRSPKGSNLPNGNAQQKPITNLPLLIDNKTYV